MNLKEFQKQLRTEKKFREEFDKTDDVKYALSQMIIDARIYRKLTQAELAKRANTKQPSIARIERGLIIPSIDFLTKLAKALDTELVLPKFGFTDEIKKSSTYNSKVEDNRTVTQDLPKDIVLNVKTWLDSKNLEVITSSRIH